MIPNKPEESNTKSHKQLWSCSKDYNPLLNLKLRLLYQGGFAIQERSDLFLEKLQGLESNQAYQLRKKSVSYVPYVSEYITQFGASLFSEELEVKPAADNNDSSTIGEPMEDDFYKQFIQHCDLKGRSLHQFMHDNLETALSELTVYIGMDFPKQDPNRIPNNKLQQKQMGLLNGYFYTIPYECVVDWKIDEETGRYVWLKTFEDVCLNDDPLAEPKHKYRFKIWRIVNNKAEWQVWETAEIDIKKDTNKTVEHKAAPNQPSPQTRYTLVDAGTIGYRFIPIQPLCIPKGYHVNQLIGPLNQEHYQRRSFLVSNANKTCVALGVVTLGPEISSPDDSLPPDIEPMDSPRSLRKQLETDGWTVVRQTDKWADKVEIIEAKGEAHKFISEELRHLVEQMAQVIRQMQMTARANTQHLARSAASKQIDQHGTSMLLSVYERIVKDFIKNLMTDFSRWRGDNIDWVPEGLSIAEPVAERTDLIEEVVSLGIDIMQYPDMFKNKYLYRIANELLDNNLSDREKLDLQEKIEEFVSQGKFTSKQTSDLKIKALGSDKVGSDKLLPEPKEEVAKV